MFDWHNEESAAMLSRGYLLDGETVVSATRRVARSAAKYADNPGLEQRVFDLIAKGWFVPASPIWANMGTDRGLPISCVTGDTWINTKYSGGKQAKDIAIGDEVLTHRGRYRKVTNVMVTENRPNIHRLKVKTRNTPLYITENHLVLTNLGWVRVDELRQDTHLVAINREIELKEEVAQINLSSFITESLPTQFQSKPIEPIHNFDEELAWAFGLWFAEGSLSTNKGKPNGLRVTMAEDELHYAEKWLEIMSRRFGVNGRSYISETSRRQGTKWCNAYISSSVLGRFFESFGKGCKVKELPQWLIESPKNVLSSFLDAMLIGDGSEKKSGHNRITLANPKLILQLYQIALKLGYDVSLQMTEKAGKLATTKYVYTLNVLRYHRQSERNIMQTIKFSDGLSYAGITELTLTDKVETVYDFTVEEDHSFSAGGIVVHNCFGSHIEDSMDGILSTLAEVGMMTKIGGGTSAYFGAIRPNGADIKMNGKSNGPVPFMQLYDTAMRVVSQGSTRRGSFAAYLPVEHPDILEFLKIKDIGFYIQDLSFGVSVTDNWMQDMIAGDPKKREVWAAVLHSRKEKGYPYILFHDTVNKMKPECYKDRTIWASNLCSEIMLPSNKDESFVCCISAMNAEKWDEWKDTDAVRTAVEFLDAVMEEFIQKAQGINHMQRAVRFAKNHRAIGLGLCGWHSLLQSKGYPFNSLASLSLTHSMMGKIRDDAEKASGLLALSKGPPQAFPGLDRRNTTLMAIAPNTSSSSIMGQISAGIEPYESNYFVKDLAKGSFTRKNKHLERILEERGLNNDETWRNIHKAGGSVLGVPELQDVHQVFLTFGEINQFELLHQAGIRQKFIDQGQSLNIHIPPGTDLKTINKLHIWAWECGVKALYYQRSKSASQGFSLNEVCSMCAG